MTRNYTIDEETRKQYAGIYLLEYIINKPHYFDLLLNDADVDLEPVLEWLMARSYIDIENDARYVPTAKGRECLVNFMARYSEFLAMFDVFCAVDLGEGTFAFADYFEYEDRTRWQEYLNQECWEDLRIAVAVFKNIDPVEIVFMSFINEGRFGRNDTGWQFDLLLGSVWDDVLGICNTALHPEDLAYEDEDGAVSGEDVLKDVISQGTELMVQLLKHESEVEAVAAAIVHDIDHGDDDDYGDDDCYVERVTVVHHDPYYYDPWYDPWYVSPLWVGVWLI